MLRKLRKVKIPILMAILVFTLISCAGAGGTQGPAGVGINNIINNGDGTFTLNLTDGSSYTTDNLTGPQGIQGPPGLGLQPDADSTAALV